MTLNRRLLTLIFLRSWIQHVKISAHSIKPSSWNSAWILLIQLSVTSLHFRQFLVNNLLDSASLTSHNSGMSSWSRFSPCSSTCGGGMQKRQRRCRKPSLGCHGKKSQTRICNNHHCPRSKQIHTSLYVNCF